MFDGNHPASRWGDTAPLLKISREFHVDYAIPLVLADSLLHGRGAWNEVMEQAIFACVGAEANTSLLIEAVQEVVARTRSMLAFAEKPKTSP